MPSEAFMFWGRELEELVAFVKRSLCVEWWGTEYLMKQCSNDNPLKVPPLQVLALETVLLTTKEKDLDTSIVNDETLQMVADKMMPMFVHNRKRPRDESNEGDEKGEGKPAAAKDAASSKEGPNKGEEDQEDEEEDWDEYDDSAPKCLCNACIKDFVLESSGYEGMGLEGFLDYAREFPQPVPAEYTLGEKLSRRVPLQFSFHHQYAKGAFFLFVATEGRTRKFADDEDEALLIHDVTEVTLPLDVVESWAFLKFSKLWGLEFKKAGEKHGNALIEPKHLLVWEHYRDFPFF